MYWKYLCYILWGSFRLTLKALKGCIFFKMSRFVYFVYLLIIDDLTLSTMKLTLMDYLYILPYLYLLMANIIHQNDKHKYFRIMKTKLADILFIYKRQFNNFLEKKGDKFLEMFIQVRI